MVFNWKLCLVIYANPLPPFCQPIRVNNPIRLEPRDPPSYMEFEGSGLDRENVRAMHTLAAIDRLSQSLPAEFAQGVQQTVAAHMQAIGHKLGTHFELSRVATES